MQKYLDIVLKFLVPTAIASILGVVILVVLEAIISATIKPVIDAVYPPTTIMSLFPTSSNSVRYDEAYNTLYWISTCIAGTVAGVYLNISRPSSQSRTWHSFTSGLVIGTSAPFIFSGFGVIFSIPAIVTALLGYEIRFYKSNSGKLAKKAAISTLIGLIVFGLLYVLFASTLRELFAGRERSEGFLIKAIGLFLFILGISGFISGWWGTDGENLKHGLMSGFVVGAIGPLLAQFLEKATSLFIVMLVFGSIAGLFGFLGSVCSYKYYCWRSGYSRNLS